jgi:DNA repair exonuclease SbcCD ATPase subunit
MSGYSGPAVGDTFDSGGPDAALAELGRAITRAADALVAVSDDDEATAYRCARALDVAFGDLTELLRTVPGIVGLGDPGPKISQRLEQRRAELATRRSQASAYREKLDDLAESERSLAEVTEEAGRLRARISELNRAERLASEIPGLRTQARALEEAVAAADAADAPEIGVRIAQAADQFAALTERQREALGEETDKLVAGAERAARQFGEQRARRDAAVADLARHESETAQLAAEHSETLPILTAWTEADADLADGLRAAGFGAGGGALQVLTTELNGIRQRLTDLDNSLRLMLAEHAKAYEDARRVRPL